VPEAVGILEFEVVVHNTVLNDNCRLLAALAHNCNAVKEKQNYCTRGLQHNPKGNSVPQQRLSLAHSNHY